MAIKQPCCAAGTPSACLETALYEQAQGMRSLYEVITEAAIVSARDDSDAGALLDFMVAFEVLMQSNAGTELKLLFSSALTAAHEVVGLMGEGRIEFLTWKREVTV
ncbi:MULTISPECIES: hypothetical protein [Pseudomonas]|jgi:hypothetical protein|uniref:Uncharacterized protein n=1 Tax=Pseudomonas helleri TaxID=1608996 RepID=A0A7X2C1K3_9PSED|nr:MULTISPECIES: hypothetical protein [Pseudomonas]MQT87559.1 hypothetical protein [Pseudomonas helleri]